jgi:hypothetical protein
MRTMFGDHRRPWLGQVEHLPGGMARGHRRRQRCPAAGTDRGIMIDHDVRRLHLTQGLARMSLLPAALLARRLAQAPGPRRFFSPSLDGGLPLLLLLSPSRRSNSAIRACMPVINSFSVVFSARSAFSVAEETSDWPAHSG